MRLLWNASGVLRQAGSATIMKAWSHMVVAIDGTGTVVFGRLGDYHESMETVFM